MGKYRNKAGYMMVREPGMKRHQPEHRKVWEDAHGPLPPRWVVHHINGIRDDNRLANLQAMTPEDHVLAHRTGKENRRDMHVRLSPYATALIDTLQERLGISPSAIIEMLVRKAAPLFLNSSDASNPDTAPQPALPQPYRRRRRGQKASRSAGPDSVRDR